MGYALGYLVGLPVGPPGGIARRDQQAVSLDQRSTDGPVSERFSSCTSWHVSRFPLLLRASCVYSKEQGSRFRGVLVNSFLGTTPCSVDIPRTSPGENCDFRRGLAGPFCTVSPKLLKRSGFAPVSGPLDSRNFVSVADGEAIFEASKSSSLRRIPRLSSRYNEGETVIGVIGSDLHGRFCRSGCQINSLQALLSRTPFPFSCNVALGEPILDFPSFVPVLPLFCCVCVVR